MKEGMTGSGEKFNYSPELAKEVPPELVSAGVGTFLGNTLEEVKQNLKILRAQINKGEKPDLDSLEQSSQAAA